MDLCFCLRSKFSANLQWHWLSILIITLMAKHLLLSLAVVALLISSTKQDAQCTIDTHKIQGNGQILLNPDIATFTIGATGFGTTAALALADLNVKINTIYAAFKNQSVPSGNYSTSTITIYNTYNYSTNPYTISGSQASQTLQLTIGMRTNLQAIIKDLGAITNVNVNFIVFDVLDRASALQQARLAAFNDARRKLNEYLALTGQRNYGLLQITDLNSDVYTAYQYTTVNFMLLKLLRVAPSQVQVTAAVSVTWRVK